MAWNNLSGGVGSYVSGGCDDGGYGNDYGSSNVPISSFYRSEAEERDASADKSVQYDIGNFTMGLGTVPPRYNFGFNHTGDGFSSQFRLDGQQERNNAHLEATFPIGNGGSVNAYVDRTGNNVFPLTGKPTARGGAGFHQSTDEGYGSQFKIDCQEGRNNALLKATVPTGSGGSVNMFIERTGNNVVPLTGKSTMGYGGGYHQSTDGGGSYDLTYKGGPNKNEVGVKFVQPIDSTTSIILEASRKGNDEKPLHGTPDVTAKIGVVTKW
jgi:hypothetical protein